MTNSTAQKLAALGIAAFAGLSLMGFRLDLGVLRLVSIALCGGAGFALGWFFSPHAQKIRRMIFYAMIAIGLVVVLLDSTGAGNGIATLLSGFAFLWGFSCWLGGAVRGFFTKPTTFGSAEWADGDYLVKNNLVGETGIDLGRFTINEEVVTVRYAGDRHLLTIAPTRSGKGTTAIIPNLLTTAATRSALVIDPKGENALVTANRRRDMGQQVHVVDPWCIASGAYERPARFNPLDWVEAGDIDMTENAMLLADALVVPPAGGDRFWVEEAKALLQGLIMFVATDEDEQGNRTLARVRDLLLLDGQDMPNLFKRMMESPHHVVASTGARCLQKEEKLLANVIASAQAETHFLDSPRIRESMSASDFKFEDLKRQPMTIYLVLPSDRLNTFGRWLRLLIQQAITVNARNIEVKPEHPVLFLLDEMPALGKLTMVEQAYGLMAGFGMQLWGIVQDAAQLKRIYGESWESFVGNSGVVQYFGSRDRMTADYFSALCGVTTVWNLSSAISQSVSSSAKGGGSNSSSNTSTSSAAQRKLAYPDELMRLPAHQALVLVENHHPIRTTKVRWFQDEELKALGTDIYHQRIAA